MGRRKIEIKAIKDDRNRSVTFLKRKGGLFKKAHELSVLCSVDVAVFIFGSNKKLYEYSSRDMRDLITRYTYHGGPNEHKGPGDFNGGADDDEDEDDIGTPPEGEGIDAGMVPPQYQGQGQAPFPPHIRGHTPSASPPVPNGMTFSHMQRSHTPQPQMGSRPASRNDMRRVGPNNMAPQPVGPPPGPSQTPPVNDYAFMPHPTLYHHQNQPNLPQPGPQYPYPQQQPHHPPYMQPYMEDQRRSSLPPNYPPGPQQGPRASVSPPQSHAQHLPQHGPHPTPPHTHRQHGITSPPQPQSHVQPPPPLHIHEPPPPPVEPRTEAQERPSQAPLLHTVIKKLPQRKQHSIFTPIDENRSVLSQHLAAFHGEAPPPKSEPLGNRQQKPVDVGSSAARNNASGSSPPGTRRSDTILSDKARQPSLASIPESTFTPPSRSNSLRLGGDSRPRLRVQIPDEVSEAGSGTAHSISPRNTATDNASLTPRPNGPEGNASGIVLPPPSPSASALLSAGATGPPNPFARPPPQQPNMNMDTPVSALPSRFLNNEFLPSPSSFYPEWNFRGSDSATLPSPLNFATPVVSSGPSFLRDDNNGAQSNKRKSTDISGAGPTTDPPEPNNGAKRIRVDS